MAQCYLELMGFVAHCLIVNLGHLSDPTVFLAMGILYLLNLV
jgi:hypothetical protein